jgi:hypothetical protein
MDREKLLAAETFSYSYANYANHLGIGHVRFEELMPQDVRILGQAEQEGWPLKKLAQALECNEDIAERFRVSYIRAKDIVDAPNAAESFRRGVRYSILDAVEEGLTGEAEIERLVTQICYRAADLAYLLDLEDRELSHYSKDLRKTTKFDQDHLMQSFRDNLPPEES